MEEGGWGAVHGRDDAQITGLIVSSWRTSKINRVCGSNNLFRSVSVRGGRALSPSPLLRIHTWREQRALALFMFQGCSSVRHAMVECNLMECSRCLQLHRQIHRQFGLERVLMMDTIMDSFFFGVGLFFIIAY